MGSKNDFGDNMKQYKKNICGDSPEKSPSHHFDMSSDSNLEIQDTEGNAFVQWLKDNLLLMVTLAGVVFGTVSGEFCVVGIFLLATLEDMLRTVGFRFFLVLFL